MKFARSHDDERERGAVLVMTTILVTVLLGMTAIVVDLGALRGDARVDQGVADFAALAAGQALAANDPTLACQAAVSYINTNAQLSTAINATTFCAGMATTSCSGGTGQATPSTTAGAYTVSVHYPVPNSEIADAHLVGGQRPNDGTPCQRIRVIVRSTSRSTFAAILGVSTLSAVQSATARPWPIGPQRTPALWLLDPTGCTSLAVSGGSQVTVGTPTVPGVLTIDSNGSTCSSTQTTISASGSGTLLQAVPTSGSTKGVIQLFALPSTATTCISAATHGCDPADVTAGRLAPQPIPVTSRATRARVDDVFNCHNPYPASTANYHGITLVANCDPTTTPPYIDNLKTAIGNSGLPPVLPAGVGTTYQRWRATFSCNPTGTISVSGNWWIDCPGGGLSIGNGTDVEFRDGNVVLDKGFSMTGGTLKFNTNNTKPALPSSCVPADPPVSPPTVTTPCTGYASPGASFVYLRDGDINITGGVLTVNHAMVYNATGYVKVNSSPPTWTAPTEGPFNYLALWCEMPATSNNTSKFSMAGGTGVQLSGVFFTPEAAPFSLTGGGTWGQQNAQFIAFQLQVSGGGTLTMAPDPQRSVRTPTLAGTLIR